MGFTIEQIAVALGAEAFGATDVVITGLAEPASAGPDDLAIAMSPKFAAGLAQGRARAGLVWSGADWQAMGLEAAIAVGRSRLALAQLTQFMDRRIRMPAGVHPTALVDGSAIIGVGAAIGPFVVIGAKAQIGAETQVAAHATIGAGAIIGDGGLILEGARVCPGVRIGDRVILHPNVVIGADGFSFTTTAPAPEEVIRKTLGRAPLRAAADATRYRISSLGSVHLGDDVEVGSNSTIDAGTIRPTSIGSGTKIDNLVQVGHNVVIGKDCLLCGHVGIAGSVRIGDRVVLAGKAGVGDNLTIGSDVVVTAACIVLSNVASGQVMTGYPAVPMQDWLASRRAVRQLRRETVEQQKQVPNAGEND